MLQERNRKKPRLIDGGKILSAREVIDGMGGEVQHGWTPAVGYGFACRGGAPRDGRILKACSTTGEVSFPRDSLADWELWYFAAYFCRDAVSLVATVLMLVSSGIADFSSITFISDMLSLISSSIFVARFRAFPVLQ